MIDNIRGLIPLLQKLDIQFAVKNITDYFTEFLSKPLLLKECIFIKYSHTAKKYSSSVLNPVPEHVESLLNESLKKGDIYIQENEMVIPLVYPEKPLAFIYIHSRNKIKRNLLKRKDLNLATKFCSLIYYNVLIYNAAVKDSLTKIFNIRYFKYKLQEYCLDSGKKKKRMGLIMMDIDHFKHYNDKYGHLIGDQILRDMAGTINQLVGSRGVFARYGGEEFILMLPNTGIRKTVSMAEKIRQEVENIRISNKYYFWRITISLGVSVFPDDAEEPVELIDCADKSLYHAKNSGRNRTSVYALDIKKNH